MRPGHAGGRVLRGIAVLARRRLRRFRGDASGATAVEFGLVIVPFLAILFAIFETALVFFAGQVLETATADAARLVLTGQQQAKGLAGAAGKADFKTELCNRVVGVFDCAGTVEVDVRVASNFAGATAAPPTTNGCPDTSGFVYQPGNPGEIIIVRAVMLYPTYVSLLGSGLNTCGSNKRLITASAAFRNEPR